VVRLPCARRPTSWAYYEHLADKALPTGLISQFLLRVYERVARGTVAATLRAFVLEAVRDVLGNYAAACGPDHPSME
jgi:tagatose-1,6-bisphosphate aldolase non-catalytic subunit AgaZ/GatZ